MPATSKKKGARRSRSTLRDRLRRRTVPTTKPARPIIEPAPDEPKSGCFFCPLAPFSTDFDALKPHYQRDWAKFQAKQQRDPHVIHGRATGSGIDWTPVDLLFVGEAPGQEEDFKKAAFVGKSGDLLRQAVRRLIGKGVRVAYANVVRCRPPRNRDPNKTEIKCCGYELVREIEARQPKLVAALGNKALEFLTQQSGITALAGRILDGTRPEFPDLKVLACFHPAYILRADYLMDVWCEALELADRYLQGTYEPPPGAGEYFVLDDADDVEALLDAFIAEGTVVSFDTETGGLQPFQTDFPRLLCFSFSDEEGVGYTIPWDHVESPWRKDGPRRRERKRLLRALRRFFRSDCPKIAHNASFDFKHVWHALGGSQYEPRNVVRDTMLTHYVVDERRGTHSLKRLALVYTGMGDYECPLKEYQSTHPAANPRRGGSFAHIPGDLLFRYAAMDADVTLRIDRLVREEPEYRKNPKLRRLAEHFYPALARVLAHLEYNGATIDVRIIQRLDQKYRAEMEQHAQKIQADPKVRQFVQDQRAAGKHGRRKRDPFVFNPKSTQQLGNALFGYYGERPRELTDRGFDILTNRWRRARDRRKDQGGPKVKFEEVVAIAIARKEWDLFSTKADVLNEYERRGNTLCPTILKFREVAQIHGTFIAPVLDRLDADHRMHGSFLAHGTVTNRLASRDPNMQNQPDAAKPAFVSRFGAEGLIGQVDYSQIELRVAASWFNDPTMIRAYREGIDLHALTAADMHHLSFAEFLALPGGERKPMRARAKRVNFGVLYGGGPPALQATLKKDGIHVTVEECKTFQKTFFEVRPHLKRGIEQLERETIKRGYLEMFTGHRRRVPGVQSDDRDIVARILRQCVNAPIQGGASAMTLMALCLIFAEMERRDYRSKLILTVHDSIIFDLHVDEAVEIMAMAKDIMERITELSDAVLPELDWSWLKCPLVADCELGHSWGALVAFDPATVAQEAEAEDDRWLETDEAGAASIGRPPVNTEELWEQMAWKAAAR